MGIVIRMMEREEALTVWKLGIRIFHSLEGIFMSKPKDAIVALDGEKIVGAALIKKYKYKGGLLGYLDYGFVDERYNGQGIGYQLYERAIRELKNAGCNEVCAMVRGDNPGSFRLCEKLGMHRCTLGDIKKILGAGALRVITTSIPLSYGSSSDFYISSLPERKDSSKQILWYLFINVLLLLFGVFAHGKRTPYTIMAGATVMMVTTLLGGSIKLFGKSKYRFRFSIGGYLVSAIVAFIGSLFPMLGKWYPEKFEQSKQQKKELCIGAIIEWVGLLLLYLGVFYFMRDTIYGRYVGNFSAAMLIYRMIPTFPFSEYGGRRIYNFSKVLYLILWIGTAVLLYMA